MTALVTYLDDTPVLGVRMGNIALLRLDRIGGLAPGNKSFKLRGAIADARRRGITRLVSFGGGWSNHLHALAAVGHEAGMETVGLVRGEVTESETDMLADARRWGMRIERVSRAAYRKRNEPEYLEVIRQRFSPCQVIPEGGASPAGVKGCVAIADLIRRAAPEMRRIAVPVGTGTTLAGLACGLDASYDIAGISALRGAADLDQRVTDALLSCGASSPARWSVLHDHHCGGFGRVSQGLRRFILAFERIHGVCLEPVYTGKMLYALHSQLRNAPALQREPTLAIHTGGLQGRRGFRWLAP
jgi:1-aminocyclopropane-1-carboxylate deaminase